MFVVCLFLFYGLSVCLSFFIYCCFMDNLSSLKEYGKDFLDTLEYNNKLNDFFFRRGEQCVDISNSCGLLVQLL